MRDRARNGPGPARPGSVPRHTASPLGASRLEKLGQPIDGVLVEDELIAKAVRACVDLASGCPSKEVVELGGGGDLIGMRLRGWAARLSSSRDLGLERAD